MNPEEAEIEKKMRDETSTVLNQLRMEQKLCDVVIETEDVKFKAHKIILCGCSSYFRCVVYFCRTKIIKSVFMKVFTVSEGKKPPELPIQYSVALISYKCAQAFLNLNSSYFQ